MSGRVAGGVALLLIAAGAWALWTQWTAQLETGRAEAARARLEHAIARGADFLASQRGRVERHSLFVPIYLGRRYGLPALAAFEDDVTRDAGVPSADPVVDRMMAYAYDRGRRVEAIELEGQHPLAALLFPALHCDHIPLPDGFDGDLAAALRQGGYEASHAALALGFVEERGCQPPWFAAMRARAIDVLAAELKRATVADDLNMETCALLGYLGAPGRVEPRWPGLVLDAQRADGGWGHARAPHSDWHHTAMALMCLLGSRRPDAPAVPILPSARQIAAAPSDAATTP